MKRILNLVRQSVIIGLGYVGETLGISNKPMIIVLCYHSIGSIKWKYNVTPTVFKHQMDQVLRSRKPINIDELTAYLNGKKQINEPSFLLTFDDGYINILNIANYLKIKKIKPCVFLLSNPSNANRKELGTTLPIASKKDWFRLQKLGWSIGSHSATHPNFSQLKLSEAIKEIKGSKNFLETTLNQQISAFALPRGSHNDVVDQIVKKSGYKICMTMDDGIITINTNPLAIPRIGIDQTHTLSELRYIDSSVVIRLRMLLKKMKVYKLYE